MICLFMVMAKRMIKYRTRIGQKTGMLKMEKKVHASAMSTARVTECLERKETNTAGIIPLHI